VTKVSYLSRGAVNTLLVYPLKFLNKKLALRAEPIMRWVVDHYLIIGFGKLLFYSKIFLPKIQLLKNDT